jgi:hypothetical protein
MTHDMPRGRPTQETAPQPDAYDGTDPKVTRGAVKTANPGTSLLDAALGYAARGWPVFPCRPGRKDPATPHGFLDATTDPDQIRAWWQAQPDANVAIATGHPGPDVVDVDNEPGGFEALGRLMRAGLLDGHGQIVRTRSGGLHLYFLGTGQRCSSLRPNFPIDFKAARGYVIAPPSWVGADDRGPGGDYQVIGWPQ